MRARRIRVDPRPVRRDMGGAVVFTRPFDAEKAQQP